VQAQQLVVDDPVEQLERAQASPISWYGRRAIGSM
jgi:hypothetical protein